MKNASKALDCISCMCCYSACPVIGLGNLTDFAGPAPLVQLGQTALDPRNDPEKVARSLALTGIFNCVSCYKCEEVCPARIPIVSQSHRAAEGQGRAARSREWPGIRWRCATLSPRAAGSIPARWCCACRACARCAICGACCGCWCAARSIRSRRFFKTKTAAAEAAGRILGRR